MVDEMEADRAPGKLYLSKRLNPSGLANFAALLQQAAQAYDEDWLASTLRNGYLETHEPGHSRSGVKKVPVNASETLAEDQFNRYYMRALCVRALADGIRHVAVYRAKQVANPRPESQARIGQLVDAQALLSELRTNTFADTALGLPPGPNSGLSVYLPVTAPTIS